MWHKRVISLADATHYWSSDFIANQSRRHWTVPSFLETTFDWQKCNVFFTKKILYYETCTFFPFIFPFLPPPLFFNLLGWGRTGRMKLAIEKGKTVKSWQPVHVEGAVNGRVHVHCNLNAITAPKGDAVTHPPHVARLLSLRASGFSAGVCNQDLGTKLVQIDPL